MKRFLLFKLITLIYLLVYTSEPFAQVNVIAQVVWNELINEEHTVLLSDFDGENWSESYPLYSSENSISSVVIGTSKVGDKVLVWSEQMKNKSVLMYKSYSNKKMLWGEVEVLSDYGYENVGASVIYDSTDQMWIFWGSNDDDLSDIVGKTFSDGRWSDVFVVNEDNDVPDIQPRAGLDSSGNVIVTWSSFSFKERGYVERSKIYYSKLSGRSGILLNDVVDYSDIIPPDFIPTQARSLIHLPGNKMVQSEYYIPSVN